MVEWARQAKDKASERVASAREGAAKPLSARRENTAEAVTAARDNAAEAIARVKPRLRGVSHEWAFFVSLVAGAALIAAAGSPKARISVAIYAGSLSALLGTSALYHR